MADAGFFFEEWLNRGGVKHRDSSSKRRPGLELLEFLGAATPSLSTSCGIWENAVAFSRNGVSMIFWHFSYSRWFPPAERCCVNIPLIQTTYRRSRSYAWTEISNRRRLVADCYREDPAADIFTVGFNSLTLGFAQRSCTAKFLVGFSKVCEDEWLAHLQRGPYIVVDTPPQIFSSVVCLLVSLTLLPRDCLRIDDLIVFCIGILFYSTVFANCICLRWLRLFQ